MNNAIEVSDLTKSYGALLAVDHIAFEVHKGEVFGFLGPNRAGKSTTQRMLTTLLTPTAGRIVIYGHDLARDAYSAKRQMGLVPEESNVYTELSAWDNLMFTASLYRVPRRERSARAQELLEIFGLWEKRRVKAEDFSKGMRRGRPWRALPPTCSSHARPPARLPWPRRRLRAAHACRLVRRR